MRLCSDSNVNFSPEHIGRFKVHIYECRKLSDIDALQY